MIKKTLLYSSLLAVLVGCGSDRDKDNGAANSDGAASISGQALVGETLTASITDENGVRAGTDTYQWFASGTQIAGADASTYTLTADEDGDQITVVIRYTDNFGFRETDESAPTGEIAGAFTLGATFIHGLVNGAECDIFAVDSSTGVAATVAAANGTTTAGVVNFGTLVPVDGTGLIVCTGGTFIDEATGNTLNAPDTRAVVMVDGNGSFVVSPLTEIAAQLAAATGDLNTAITTHNEAIAGSFGLSGDITETQPTDLSTTAANDDEAGKYASILALVSQLDANDAGSTTAEIIAGLSSDLADGTFSQATVDDLNTAQTDLASSAVAANLNDTALRIIEDAINNEPEAATFEGLAATIPNDQADPLTGTITVTDTNFGESLAIVQTDTPTTYGTFSIAEDGTWSYSLDIDNTEVSSLDVGASINDTIAIQSLDGTPANLVIRITSLTQAAEITNTINGDTGELRLNLENHLLEGKVSFSFFKTEALADDGNEKDAYITLYGNSGSSSESLIDLRIQGEATEDDGTIRAPRFLVRNTDSDAYPGSIITAPFSPNEWYDIEITWDLSQTNQLTVSINGEIIGGGAFSTAAVVDSDFTSLDQWFPEGVERVQWRFGDNGTTIPFGSYVVDDVVIYSDAAGTVVAFEDDFEGNTVGDVLGAAPYASDSVDVDVIVFDAGASVDPVPAAFFNLVGAISSDDTNVLMDMVSVIDPDDGEDLLIGQADIATTYGTFSIMPSGAWDYTLDTTNSTIAALVQGDRETDTITITSIDGTTAELVITINGVGGDTGGSNNVAVIVDTTDDTGELRYALDADGPLAAGRVEAKIQRLDDDLGDGDAFITLFNENTNNDGAILDLRIRDSSFGIRNPSSTDTSALTVVLDQFMDVVLTWEYPGGDTTLAPQVTVEVDGVSMGPAITPDNNPFGGVTHVSFRFGDNGGVRPDTGRVTIDDLAIFSDTAGTTEVFSDDFESYLDGDSLDTDNGASPYHSNTADATVETIGAATNAVAVIVDTTDDTGELRYALDADGPLAAGRLEAKVQRLDDDLGDGDAFITLFNENTNNDGAILDLRIRDSSFGVRNPSSTDTSALTVVLDQFMDVVITWEYPGGDTTLAPQVTVEVDGVSMGAAITPDNSPFGGVTHVAFRFGDNGGVRPDTGRLTIDDLVIYSDTAGTTAVFSDDFESYLDGDSLDTDNAASPYHSNTADATVEVTGGAASGPGTTGNQVVVITDTSDADTGELRRSIDALLQGKMTVSVRKEATQDGFINLSGNSSSRSNAMIDIRIDDTNGYEFTESGDTVNANANFPVFANDTWVNLEITWDATVAGAPLVSVTIDGQAVTSSAFPSEGTLENIQGGVETIQFRLGGNSDFDPTDAGFAIDDLRVYSDIAGTTLVLSDDFESYTVGNSLDPNADTASNGPIANAIIEANTPYNSNSFQVTVDAEE